MKKYGSQIRESLNDSGYSVKEFLLDNQVVLEDSDGELEVWALNDGHAGYTIEINGQGYEFVRGYYILT